MKKETIAAVVGVGAIGVAAFMLTRGNSNSQPKQSQPSSAFSGYSGGGATGGYSEPTVAQTVSSVLERVLNQTTQSPALPEMTADMNPSDEAADVRQKTSLAADHVTSRATGESMYSMQSVYSSKGGKTTGHVGGTRRDKTMSKAVEYEENQ